MQFRTSHLVIMCITVLFVVYIICGAVTGNFNTM